MVFYMFANILNCASRNTFYWSWMRNIIVWFEYFKVYIKFCRILKFGFLLQFWSCCNACILTWGRMHETWFKILGSMKSDFFQQRNSFKACWIEKFLGKFDFMNLKIKSSTKTQITSITLKYNFIARVCYLYVYSIGICSKFFILNVQGFPNMVLVFLVSPQIGHWNLAPTMCQYPGRSLLSTYSNDPQL